LIGFSGALAKAGIDAGVCAAGCAHHDDPHVATKSNAVPSGPDGRPWPSRDNALRIASESAPCCTANENAIAASRALVSAALLDLWFDKNSSPTCRRQSD